LGVGATGGSRGGDFGVNWREAQSCVRALLLDTEKELEQPGELEGDPYFL